MHAPKGQGQGPSTEKGRRKLMSKDWEHVEIMSFIKAKCDELFANFDFVDP
jgi:hypothetical protein